MGIRNAALVGIDKSRLFSESVVSMIEFSALFFICLVDDQMKVNTLMLCLPQCSGFIDEPPFLGSQR